MTEHRDLAQRVGGDGHLRGEGEVLELARHPALDDGRVVVGVLQCVDKPLADLGDALRVVADGVAVGVEHDIGIEGELAGGGDDPRVLDAQVELVHGGHGDREEIVLVGGVDENLRTALELALGGFLDQHQRRAVVRVLEDRLGVPGHVAGGVAQEVVVAELAP